jgi:hypothetical protein
VPKIRIPFNTIESLLLPDVRQKDGGRRCRPARLDDSVSSCVYSSSLSFGTEKYKNYYELLKAIMRNCIRLRVPTNCAVFVSLQEVGILREILDPLVDKALGERLGAGPSPWIPNWEKN